MPSIGALILPTINDFALGARVTPLRKSVVSEARGRVLEIGAGTGLNFAHYEAGTEVVAVEPAYTMRRRAEVRARERDVRAKVTLLDARADALPLDAASFDAAVVTFVLCSIDDLASALREAHRVLRPGGAVHLIEHVRDPDPRVSKWQTRVEPVWSVLLAGCRLTRDLPRALTDAGFDPAPLAPVALPLPRIVSEGVRGTMVKG